MTRLLTFDELMALAEQPATVTVAFIRPGVPRDESRGVYKVNERAELPYQTAMELCQSGAAAVVGRK
jgi:hypothetical protein